jgi:hypothetical protein
LEFKKQKTKKKSCMSFFLCEKIPIRHFTHCTQPTSACLPISLVFCVTNHILISGIKSKAMSWEERRQERKRERITKKEQDAGAFFSLLGRRG